MKFSKVIGKCDPALIAKAEEKFSAVMSELSMSYGNKSYGSKLGGDIIMFQLLYPPPH